MEFVFGLEIDDFKQNMHIPQLTPEPSTAQPPPPPFFTPFTISPPPFSEGKENREGIIVVVRSPCQENYPADAHPSAHKSVLVSANPAWTRSMHLDAPGQRHGQQPVSGTADPGVVKQDKSSRGSVDTTKTRSGPQRVRMSSGERPIGTAKGKQSETEALCQTPPFFTMWNGLCQSVEHRLHTTCRLPGLMSSVPAGCAFGTVPPVTTWTGL